MGNITSACLQPLAFPLPLNISTCDLGFLCPYVQAGNEFTFPSICPPTIACQLTRLGSAYCEPQGVFEPYLCPPGSYCPDTATAVLCAEGTYCQRGSFAPLDCGPLSYCPAGTAMRRFYGGVLIALLLDIALAAVCLWARYVGEPGVARRRRERRLREGAASGAPVELGALSARKGDGASYEELGESLLRDAAAGGGSSSSSSGPRAILEEGFRLCNQGLRIDLEFSALSLTLPPPTSKTILSNVSGRIRPGRVTAIMGPSGAGKTTFLSVLMGKLPRTAGALRINGAPDEMTRWRRITGFVPQEDTMMRELTVRENILFSARCRLPRGGEWDRDATVQRHVDAVIDVLGLSECADTLVDRISGGQRKRTNIGMELAMAPAAIFLDEPTSGLDATAALEVCSTLKAIADLGLTVVAVIHQPRYEIFESFDDLLLLAPGGLTVFMGPVRHVVPYFEDCGFRFMDGHNPADDLLDFVAGKCSDAAMPPAGLNTSGVEDSSEGDEAPRNLGDAVQVSLPLSPLSLFSATGGSVKPPTMTPASKASIATQLALRWSAQGLEWLGIRMRGDPSSPRKLPLSPVSGGAASLGAASVSINGTDASGGAAAGDADDLHPVIDIVAVSKSRGASFLRQCFLAHNRSLLQQYRQAPSFALEMGVGFLAGGIMGAAATAVDTLYLGILKAPYTLISPAPMETLLPSIGLYVALAVGLAGSPAGVRTFGEERDVFYREASSGHDRLAYYVAKSVAVMYRLTAGAFHFASVFFVLATPSMPFATMFGIVWLQFFSVYGLAAVTSMLVERENSALLGVIVSLIVSCMCGFGPNLHQGQRWGIRWVQDISYSRWANEAWFHAETLAYRRLYLVEEVSAPLFGYTLDRLPTDVAYIILIGSAYRVVAYALLVSLNRSKQR